MIPDRLMEKIYCDPNSGCWIWEAHLNRDGYGMVTYKGKTQSAHRLIYKIESGDIPNDMQLDHLCRVRCCVNLNHLEPVTLQENIRRGNTGKHQSERTHCPKGHEYSAENTYVCAKGSRQCRTCNNERSRLRRRQKALIAECEE